MKAKLSCFMAAILSISCSVSEDFMTTVHKRGHRSLPPMEDPLQADDGPNALALIPGIVQGNQAHIPPGQNKRIINLSAADSAARMYTLAVYPRLSNPNALFNGADPGSIPTVVADWSRFAVVHTVKIEYGIGGQGSQSVFVDLKRGIKVSLPCSSLIVTVYNNFDSSVTDAVGGIDVGASVGVGPSGNNDGLTLTARKVPFAAGAPEQYFGVPPHAKAVTIYATRDPTGSTNGASIVANFRSLDPVTAEHAIMEYSVQQQPFATVYIPQVFGPVLIPGDLTNIGIVNPNLFGVNVRVVWSLNL